MSSMKILLIDDETAFVEKLSSRLSKRGFSVSTAADGLQGLEVFLNSPDTFDVIITDIKMPVMSGIELLNRIRKNDFDTPVVIMSGYDDMTQSIEALRLGAFDYLTKPIRLDQLYSCLSKLASIRRASRKVQEILPFISGQIEIEIPSQLMYVESVIAFTQRQVDPVCKTHGINQFNISLCLQEALSNAILHGNLEIPSPLKEESWEKFELLRKERENDPIYKDRSVQIRYSFSPTELIFEVEDQGNGFDPSTLPDYADPGSLVVSSGRGLLYILTFMDEVTWNQTGNLIRMKKLLPVAKKSLLERATPEKSG